MLDITTYIRDTIKLANSIIFKFEHINIYVNQNLNMEYGIPIPTKENSKYYLNMYGIPHNTDSELLTYVPDTDNIQVLTKDMILKYPMLKNDLLTKGVLYNKLISTYRKETSLIKGIINPIPLDISINASDGDILFYDNDYISVNENSIIVELSNFIKTYISTYYNKKYNIDKYYLPGFLTTLYNNLPLQILRIRLSKLFTSEVDDFNLYAYFNSNKYIEKDNLSFLDKKSLIWLYGNLKHLNKHMGHNSTLNSVIDELYIKNNIGVTKLMTNTELPVLEDVDNIDSVLYSKYKHFIGVTNNDTYTSDTYTLEDVMRLELNLNLIQQNDYNDLYTYNQDVLDKNNEDINTGVYMFDKVDIKILYNLSVLNLIFNNLLYYTKQDSFTFNTLFLNPSNNKYIEINNNNIFYIMLYAIIMVNGNEAETLYISDYNINGIITNDIDIDYIIKDTVLKDKLKPIVEDILDIVNDIELTYNVNSFTNRINSIKRIYSKMWYYITNSNDIVLAADLKIVFDKFIKRYTYQEDDTKSVRDFIDEHVGTDFVITKELAFDTIVKLCNDVFSLNVNEYTNVDNVFEKYIKLINKFKSYTVQFLYDSSYLKTINNYSTSLTLGQQHRSIGNIYNAYFKRNNNINIVLSSISLSYRDSIKHSNELLTPYNISKNTNNIAYGGEQIFEYNDIFIVTNT